MEATRIVFDAMATAYLALTGECGGAEISDARAGLREAMAAHLAQSGEVAA